MDLELILREKKALASYNLSLNTELNYLRPKQLQCLREVVQKDLIAVLPTGYGKSLVYELLPFYCKFVKNISCTVIVIVPLNSILQQEVEKLGDSIVHVRILLCYPKTVLHWTPRRYFKLCFNYFSSHQ